mmetsp:Transcript_24412/g.52879  ORF Transcript_24412/g.52879 Transcript_24412/m.52879 type:complete len:116 (-) Transcript_24412:2238-2585(-)
MTCTWQRKHLKNCSHCPAAILEKYKRRKENDTRGRKAYWEKAAKQVRNAGCICAFLSFHHLPGLLLIYPYLLSVDYFLTGLALQSTSFTKTHYRSALSTWLTAKTVPPVSRSLSR